MEVILRFFVERIVRFSRFDKYVRGFLYDLPKNHRHAVLDNPAFFSRNLTERIAQEGHVVVPYVRDNRNLRVDNVRRIEASPHAHLDHRYVNVRIAEVGKGHRRAHFEKGGFQLLKYF